MSRHDGWSTLVAIACSPGLAARGDLAGVGSHYAVAVAALAAALGEPAGRIRARELIDTKGATMDPQQRLRLAAPLIAHSKPDAEQCAQLLGPRAHRAIDLRSLRTPWMLLDVGTPSQGVFMHTQSAEAAAAHVASVAAGDESLRGAAANLWIDAAAEHARRGRHADARRALDGALTTMADDQQYKLAPLLIASNDAARALELLNDIDMGDDHGKQMRVSVSRALAFAHLGRMREAHYAADAAFRASSGPQRTSLQVAPSLFLLEERIEAAWLWAATSFATGRQKEVARMLREVRSEQLDRLAELIELTGADESERRAVRADMHFHAPVASVLPAVMMIASQLAPADKDAEVWLDRVFHDEHMRQPLRAMVARAEAARWRRAMFPALQWDERATRLRQPMRDYRHAVLAYLIELR